MKPKPPNLGISGNPSLRELGFQENQAPGRLGFHEIQSSGGVDFVKTKPPGFRFFQRVFRAVFSDCQKELTSICSYTSASVVKFKSPETKSSTWCSVSAGVIRFVGRGHCFEWTHDSSQC